LGLGQQTFTEKKQKQNTSTNNKSKVTQRGMFLILECDIGLAGNVPTGGTVRSAHGVTLKNIKSHQWFNS